MKLKDMAIDHSYYCSDNNYYSNEPAQSFLTATDFLDGFEDADIDMNLVFRFDIHQDRGGDDNFVDSYSAEVFIIMQRKGIFKPCYIKSITESELDRFVSYLQKHKNHLNEIWEPLT